MPIALARTRGGRFAVPIIVGGDEFDACSSAGTVEGLNPHGDGFLTVKAGPGVNFERIDKLNNGMHVYICDERGDWFTVELNARHLNFAPTQGAGLHRRTLEA